MSPLSRSRALSGSSVNGVGRRTGVRLSRRLVRPLALAGCYALLGVLLSACGANGGADAGMALAIDGEPVPYDDFEGYLRRQLGGGELALDGVVESRLLDRFIDERLVVLLARDRGLITSSEPVEEQDAVSFLLRDQRRAMLTEDRLRDHYETHRSRYERPAEVWLRQILVDDPQRATAAYEALQDGESFVDVAARFSQGPKAQQGGDQGRLSKQDLPPEFVDVIFNLEPGEISEVVEADYGLHIFQVTAVYAAEVQPFEDVVDDIRQELLRLQVDEVVDGFFAEARKRYNVQVFPLNLPFDYQGSFSYDTQDTP